MAMPATAFAYVGPGAGFAFLASAMALVVTIFALVFGILLWPFRLIYRLLTWKKTPNRKRIRRAVIVGLDGLDPERTSRLISEGRLPNLKRLQNQGKFHKLDTTYPAMSPVAWSSFATGAKPCKHSIFDFLAPDPNSYLPVLSSAKISPPLRSFSIGRFKIPLGKPEITLLRRSRSFWKVLSEFRVPCSILRVPITFPPEKFGGTLLSAMCAPDLLGTQGTYTLFTTETKENTGSVSEGRTRRLSDENGVYKGIMEGPDDPMRGEKKPLTLEFTLTRASDGFKIRIGKETVSATLNKYTPWVKLEFRTLASIKIRGACRFRLLATEPHVRLYVTPLNLHPENPAMPISHPSYFSVFLSKLTGVFATLGLAEDTWARNENIIDDRAFLEQTADIHEERERMFFEMLKRTRKGLVACVFDATDRVQHMFMKQAENKESKTVADNHGATRFRNAPSHLAVDAVYESMDEMIGRVFKMVNIEDKKNLLIVLSDHGFKAFRRGVNLNAWLQENGYLVLKKNSDGSKEWLRGVDWEKTRAYSIGLAGIYLNRKNRERRGIVEPGAEADKLAREIADKLSGLKDANGPEGENSIAIRKAYTAQDIYSGPYKAQAPDIVAGYAEGYRASWAGAKGCVEGPVFEDNEKAWSGDHCIDPALVPGVLFTNHSLDANGRRPCIIDIAPTVLSMFGIPKPAYMDGEDLSRNIAVDVDVQESEADND